MENICLKIIPPILRGLTFDGEKGNIVVFSEETGATVSGEPPFATLTLSSNTEDDLIRQTINTFTEYRERNGKNPSALLVKDCGTFCLGKSYDEARNKYRFKTNTPDHDMGRSAVVCGKISVVTGGAQGFGEGIVRALAEAGSLVFIADLNAQKAQDLAGELNSRYKRTVALSVKVNVTDEDSVKEMVSEIVKKAGGIDIFISNAGVLKAGSVKEMDFKDFSFVTGVNYYGYFLCTKHVSVVMDLQNRVSGSYFSDIIQINSKSGLRGSNKNGAYAGGKFGGIGLTQSFALELVTDNIKVNSICPGNFFEGPLWSDPDSGLFVQYLRTGKVPGAKTIEDVRAFYESRVPMNRGCRAEDVVKAIYYVIDQKYETGQAVPVTGGQVMLKG